MTGVPATSRPAGADRRLLWLVLVLLVGLLAMHGLASDHASTSSPSQPLAASDPHVPDGGMAARTGMPPVVPVTSVGVAGPRAEPRMGHAGMAMAGLCLAVLTGALLLLAAARRLPRARPDDRLPARLLARARVLPAPRPPDLVAGLCVSRT